MDENQNVGTEEESEEQENEYSLFNHNTGNGKKGLSVQVNRQLDTGAAVSIISKATHTSLSEKPPPLEECKTTLRGLTQDPRLKSVKHCKCQ